MERLKKYSLHGRGIGFFLGLTALAAAFSCRTAATPSRNAGWSRASLTALEQRTQAIDAELASLAELSMRNGLGTGGFRSLPGDTPNRREWVRIDWMQDRPIDQITLVPAIRRRSRTGFQADGFPVEFKLIAGSARNPGGTVIAAFSAADHLLPRIAPVTVSFPPVSASWIRLEADLLSRSTKDNRFALQLAEIMVFSGLENIALHSPVQVSSDGQGTSLAIYKEALVDGQTPYVMDAARGPESPASVSNITGVENPALTIDLGETYPLDELRMHALEVTDTVPQTTESATGIPFHMRVEGAERPDFSDAVLLLEYRRTPPYETGPILMQRFPKTPCRYVRLSVAEPYRGKRYAWLAFAEIELLSKSRNVSRGRRFQTSYAAEYAQHLDALTDGSNLYGEILPIRTWVEQLARRHSLESERAVIAEELTRRYARQQRLLQQMTWLTALLLAGTVFAVLLLRILQMNNIARIRERFAADLHDELGANIHTIGLIQEMAVESLDTPEQAAELLQRSRELTRRTGTAVRHCISLQEAGGQLNDLPDAMHKAARRILADLEYDLSIEGEALLETLRPRTRTDLFLFYKECLVNISRHADADHFSTTLTAGPKTIRLVIADNGQGIGQEIPASLQRRARLLRAQLTICSPETGGTEIILQLRRRRWRPRRFKEHNDER